MILDKGYEFVDLPPRVVRSERPHARWDRRMDGTLSGRVELSLRTEQPVHIGSGGKEVRDGRLIVRAARVHDGAGVPGSSLKGVLRARYEASTCSCAGEPLRSGQFMGINSSSTEFTRALFLPDVPPSPPCGDQRRDRTSCSACALFGRMSSRSRITVTDLTCVEPRFELVEMPMRYSPNLHHAGPRRGEDDHFVVTGLHGRKFHRGRGPAAPKLQSVEVIPLGRVLTGQIRIFNVTPVELGGLLSALGIDPHSALKLGGGKSHGFGRIRCAATFHLSGSASRDPAVWRAQLMASADYWGRGEAQLLALHGKELE